MASISTDAGGLRRLQFINGAGERKTIRLGNVSMRVAKEIKMRVEALNAAKVSGIAPDNETAAWVAKIEDGLVVKLAAVGLIAERVKAEASTLGGLIRHVTGLRADAKPRTLTNLKQAAAKFTSHFGDGRPLDGITPSDADEFVAALRKRYAPAHVARLIKYGKQFFHAARRAGLVTASPFDGVKAGTMANPDRMYFLTREDTATILEACPDAEWRLIVALARFGGLRCPSEVVALTWADVDWERGRFLVRAPKTAHHADGGRRWVPLFPELRPHLERAFELAEPRTVYVVQRTRCHETNLRTGLERIVYKAGLIPWAKPFQNMRATRETELAGTFPLHVVTAWIGNSARVAAKHYLQVTEADYQRAAEGKESTAENRPVGNTGGARAAHKAAQSAADLGSLDGTIVPRGEEKGREIPASRERTLSNTTLKYARQESKNRPYPLRIRRFWMSTTHRTTQFPGVWFRPYFPCCSNSSPG
jgi:integrase